MAGADDIALLRVLSAQGRLTRTAALATARAQCMSRLRELGFDVHERPFEYSTIPARFGMAVVGVASIGFLSAAVAMRRVGPVGSAGIVALGLVALTAISHWFTSARALRGRAARTGGVNLEATRGAESRIWLVAHLDSKSQRYPLALRAAGAALTAGAWLALTLQIAWVAVGGGSWPGWVVLAPGLIGAALLALASVGNESPGAVDNASGVVTVLAAAALLDRTAPVGVLITDAEEIGLAGAHAWATGRAVGTAINCDTVDDEGTLMLLTSGRRSHGLLRAAAGAALRIGSACHVRRTPMGVLTDGVAFTRAGWSCATLSRATVGTLMRIHTARDSVEHLAGTGIASAAAFLAATVQELL